MEYIIKKNPNKEIFDEISKVIKENDNYCCCAITKNEDSLCICKNFREQKEGGFCHCGRYYKVSDYPIITIIHAPTDNEYALNLAYSLTKQGFIVTLPFCCDTAQYIQNVEIYREIQKTKIDHSDIVFVLNTSEEAVMFLEEEICWAEELNKKIIYNETEEESQNET